MGFLVKDLTDAAKNSALADLESIATELGCSLGQLAIAWAARNPAVSMVITGASKLSQLHDNLGAIDIIAQLTPELLTRIDQISLPLAS